MSLRRFQLISLAASLAALTACTPTESDDTGMAGTGGGSAGTNGSAAGTNGSTAGTNGGTAGTNGGTAGTTGGGVAGTSGGTAGTNGNTAGTGGGTAGTGGGTAGTGGGTAGTGGGATKPINVMGTGISSGNFNGQPFFFNRDKKPVQGKLVLFLGGIGGGPGSGGFDTFTKKYGFHIFMPKTNTSLTGCAGNDPMNVSAGYRRWSLWDGVDRGFGAPAPAASMLAETIAFLKDKAETDPDSDWGYFLNADGTLRTTDVYVVGYSWGGQTWAFLSQYVNFGRVIVTAAPVDEGCPNDAWMTKRPSATPDGNKYALIDQQQAWPGEMNAKFKNVMKAGWVGEVTNVTPTSPGPYTEAQHLFSMLGSNGSSPGGHTVFCNDNPQNGWIPVCEHVMGVKK
jgi:pimeloyl-ACP methyl ester carboxylesterase